MQSLVKRHYAATRLTFNGVPFHAVLWSESTKAGYQRQIEIDDVNIGTHSDLRIAAFWELLIRPESEHVPKYCFPLAFILPSNPFGFPVEGSEVVAGGVVLVVVGLVVVGGVVGVVVGGV